MKIEAIILFVVIVLVIAVRQNKKGYANSSDEADMSRATEYLMAEQANASLGVCKICGKPMDTREFSDPYEVLFVCTNRDCDSSQTS